MNPRIAAAEDAIRNGRPDAAIAELVALLEEDPDQAAETYLTLGRQLYLAGRVREGERWSGEGVRRHPNAWALWNLRGVMLRLLHRPAEALSALERAQALNPQELGPQVNRGAVLLDLGRAQDAKAAFSLLLAEDPQDPLRQLNLGRAEAALGEAAAEDHIRQAVALKPDYLEAWLQLASLAGGRHDAAEAVIDEALLANPDRPELLEARAMILRSSGQNGRLRAYLEALEPRMPDAAWLQFHLGDLIGEHDRPNGVRRLRRAVALDPSLDHLTGLIQSLERTTTADEGERLDEAYELCGRALAIGGLRAGQSKALRDVFVRVAAFDDVETLGDFRTTGRAWAAAGLHTALLKQLARVRSMSDRLELLEQHRIWGRAVEARAAQTPLARKEPRPRSVAGDDRIRLGFMSSDLRRHPVSFFALPLFDHIDRSRFEVFCYSGFLGEEDPVQAHITRQASAFRWMPQAGARQLAQVISDDRLDMLIELGGSTQMNRVEALAWRPAPVQASWLGYPHSVGLEAIDYLICDPWTTPPDLRLLAEKPLILPRTWLSFGAAVFEAYPGIEPGLPQDRTGALTFGTANHPRKYTREGLRAWARIVAAVPGSRFAVIRTEAASAVFRANLAAEFAAEGVSDERLQFHDARGGHMGLYNQVDISLDTFPLTGGTTTAESLWMGVPVVSLRGPAFYERLSASILANAGLEDLIADDREGFERIALELAADRPRRVALRAGLRDQIRRSPLGQTEAFARHFYGMIARAVGRP